MLCLSDTEGHFNDVLHTTEARQQPSSQSLGDTESIRTGSHRNMYAIHVPWRQTSAAIETATIVNSQIAPPTRTVIDTRLRLALPHHLNPFDTLVGSWCQLEAAGGVLRAVLPVSDLPRPYPYAALSSSLTSS